LGNSSIYQVGWLTPAQVTTAQQLAAQVSLPSQSIPAYPSDSLSYAQIGASSYYANPTDSRFNGSGYSIAILDSGADLDNPAFGPAHLRNGIMVADRIVYEHNFVDNNNDANDDDSLGHGTNVASIISGEATGANLIILKVLPGGSLNIASALQWVAANQTAYNIVAVNMSLGFRQNLQYGSTDLQTIETLTGFSNTLALLKNDGVACIAASGNSFEDDNSVPGVDYPAADPSVIAVGATHDANIGPFGYLNNAYDDTTAPDRIAAFTQRDPTLLDIMAPGVLITGAGLNGGTSTLSGTSQATPHVAAAVVLAQQINQYFHGSLLTVDALQSLMQATGVSVYDGVGSHDPALDSGGNEDDNVTNTEAYYKRLDVQAMADAIAAPEVIDVSIANSLGATYDFANEVGSGQQLKTVAVGQADQIIIKFSEDVVVHQSDLTLASVVPQSGIIYDVNGVGATFNYDPSTHIATWTLPNSFPIDRIKITLSDNVTDQPYNNLTNQLDGEWNNPGYLGATSTNIFPSGNGTAGGSFKFYFTVLPGDSDQDNIVSLDDKLKVNDYFGSSNDWAHGDYNGDGTVNLADKLIVDTNYGYRLLFIVGDWDLSGELTNADVQAGINAMQNLSGYESTYGLSFSDVLAIGDLNHDGQITNDDLTALEALLAG
jgi:hypothetical protein